MPPAPNDTADSLRRQAATARRLADDVSPHEAERLRRIADDLEARAAELDAADRGDADTDGET